MGWTVQDLGAIGEFIASIAVLVTLIYLAIQSTQTKRQMKISIRQARTDTVIRLQLERISNESVKSALMKATGGAVLPWMVAAQEKFGLTPEEADTLYWHGIAFFHYHANTIANIEELRPAERKAFEGTLKMQYASPLVADWYQYNSVGLDQDAVQFIDRLLLQK
jgi:hypothetical protein